MFCTQCGHNAGPARFCGQCGAPIQMEKSPHSTPPIGEQRAPTPPIPPPPPAAAQFRTDATTGITQRTPPIPPPPAAPRGRAESTSAGPPSSPGMADRVAATGKVVGLSGCVLALIFWIGIPLIVILIALAASSSTGFAIVVGSLAVVAGFVYWVWKRTGN